MERSILITIYSTNADGEIIILFDSRWKHPEVFGYNPEDPQYKLLQKLWEEVTGETIPEKETAVFATETALSPSD